MILSASTVPPVTREQHQPLVLPAHQQGLSNQQGTTGFKNQSEMLKKTPMLQTSSGPNYGLAITVLWVSPKFWSTHCRHMLFNSWDFPNCCLTVEDGTTSSVSSGEPGPNNAMLQTAFRMFEGAYSYYVRNFLNCRGRFCWF